MYVGLCLMCGLMYLGLGDEKDYSSINSRTSLLFYIAGAPRHSSYHRRIAVPLCALLFPRACAASPRAPQVWDMEKSEIVRKKTICHASVLQGVPLPITADRDEGHQVVGLAAQVGLSLSSETRATPS